MKKTMLLLAVIVGQEIFGQVPRLSLYEEFTGENCPPCAATNPALDSKLNDPLNMPKVVTIKWQVPIPSAPSAAWSLYQTYKSAINWRHKGWNGGYGNTNINPPSIQGYGYPSQNTSTSSITSGVNSAPSGRFDGRHVWHFGANSDHPFYVSNAVIASAQAVPSPFHIVLRKEWNVGQTALNATVHITAATDFTASGSLIFRLVMVEKTITFSVAPGSNGEKVFHNVAIEAFPTLQGGTPVMSTWIPGQTATFTLNCPLPSYTRDLNQVDLVGFIQDDGNREVLQAVRAKECTEQQISVTSDKNVFCKDESVTLTASGATGFLWGGGLGTSPGIIFTPTTNTVITVVSADSGACENIAVVNIVLGQTQTITASTTKSVICAGQTTTLSASGANSFTWSSGGSNSQVLVNPAKTSTYTVHSADPDVCANSAEVVVTVNDCTGIPESASQGIRVYPNPADGIFTVSGHAGFNDSMVVFDFMGRKVSEHRLSEILLPFSITLPRGVYFYSFISQGKTTGTGKIVVN